MADSISGNLVTRKYNNFRGVDYRDGEISLNRSPDALNLWKNYRNSNLLETRPDIELSETYDNTIFGLFFYRVGNKEMRIVHCGTKLYKEENGTRTELYSGMNIRKSQSFVYNNIFYIKDGINYLSYDGETIGEVTGYIPTTSIGRSPTGGGTIYEDVNMLSDYRKNGFNGDGESTEYHLDTQSIDSVLSVMVNDNLIGSNDYSIDLTRGIIIFNTAPSKPLTDGQDNVFITFKKTVAGYRERINKCTLLTVFDNRVFFSGNQDYPNVLWHCSLNDPTYVSDLDYYNEGLDLAPIKSMVAGNNALWVFKEPSQANTTVFYHNPTIDAEYGKIYPSSHSSISTGCIATGINFNDDICFFSDRGLEGISGDITSEQVLAHRSSLVDAKLLAEANYKDMILEEWEGYLLVFIDNKVYLADSRQMFTLNNNYEYEWFYWELSKKVTCTCVKDGILYLGTEDGIYTLDVEEKEYKKVEFIEENGSYVLYGESTQNGTPTPTSPKEIVNTYKAGNYRTIINGREYKFTLDDDLRSVENIKDRIEFNNGSLKLTKNISSVILTKENVNSIIIDINTSTYDIPFCVLSKINLGWKNTYMQKISLMNRYDEISAVSEVSDGKFASNFVEQYLDVFDTRFTDLATARELMVGTQIFIAKATPITTELNYTVSPLSYWTTPLDNFKYGNYQKTTNKRGCVIEVEGESVSVSVKTNKDEMELIKTFENVSDYIVTRIKRKKFKDIQLKIHSNRPVKLESITLEAFIGAYIKR